MIARHQGACRPHEYQDRVYGKGYRVMNPVKTTSTEEPAYRCTVCAPPKVKGKRRGGEYRRAELNVR